jgi:hypothetical protein
MVLLAFNSISTDDMDCKSVKNENPENGLKTANFALHFILLVLHIV